MKITIITATYNSAATIRDTLEAVRNQDYPDIEHLIIDGASTDATLSIVKEYPHVYRVVSEQDNGIYDAMNKGIAQATGEVIGILNSDDIYVDGSVISKVMERFRDDRVDTTYADLRYVRQDDPDKTVRIWRSGRFTRKKFYFGWMPPHPTFFVRKRIYDKVGLFNCALRSSADYEFMLRALVKHEVSTQYIPEILVKMRTGGMSNATLQHRIRANREDRKAWELNDMRPHFFTLTFKPLRKILQFLGS